MATDDGSSRRSVKSTGQRHVRNTSEPLYSSDFLAPGIAQSFSSDATSTPATSSSANTPLPSQAAFAPSRPRLSTLERQWSSGSILHASGDGYLQSQESPFHQPSWSGTSSSPHRTAGRRSRSMHVTSNSSPDSSLHNHGINRTVSSPADGSKKPVAKHEGDGSSMIHDAARITDWPSVAALCKTHPEHAKYAGPDGWTALHHACNRRCPHANVVEALLKAYPDALLLEEEKGMTPLHYACRFKAPTDAVRLLLHLYPSKGHVAVSKRDRKGRTPLFYAVRYDAPPGVMEMLLEIDPSVVLEEDRNAESPLAVVWDSWAEKFEGKTTLQPFLTPELGLSSDMLMERLKKKTKLASKWKTVNLFLRAAFGFTLRNDKDDDDNNKNNGKQKSRRWRVLHACCAIKCHPTLFQLSLSLYPEQVWELDDRDLYPDVERQTALHLAAASPAWGETGRVILTSLLERFPEAAQIPDSKDGSLPLHRAVENERKSHWALEGAKDIYEAYHLAVRRPDDFGKLPLHRAAAAHHRPGRASLATDDEEHEEHDSPSVVCSLVVAYPEAAAHADDAGRLPLHVIAEHGEEWDSEAEVIYRAYQTAVRVRAGPRLHNRLPIHIAAASPDARRCLVKRLVELHPLGVTQQDRTGKLPLHLVCESGKVWDKGVSAIYNAFPNAIRLPEGNSRRWYALTMAAASPHASPGLIQQLVDHYPDAAAETDSEGRYPLHWACASGMSWDGGLHAIFHANPEALLAEDHLGLLPLHVAAFQFWSSASNAAHADKDQEATGLEQRALCGGTSFSTIIAERTRHKDDLPKIEIIFELLRAEPSALDNRF